MESPEFSEALHALDERAPTAIADTLSQLARRVGARTAVTYLVDFEHQLLFPVPARGNPLDTHRAVAVSGTQAGRAFAERTIVSERDGDDTRIWAPILEASTCTGVLDLLVEGVVDDAAVQQFEELAMLAGAVLSIASRQTDLFQVIRRRREMSLPASMQWDLLPPLRITAPEGSSTGLLEPAYDVGGDCFDHAINGFVLDVAIMDAMGHGLGSSLTSALAVGSYRHDRREGSSLDTIHRRLDATLAGRFHGESFVTGQLAKLDLRNGRLVWVNAGHPNPLLLRRGRVVGPLVCRPSLPWGLGGDLVEQAEQQLEPGDVVVFYSDGVVEGRSADGASFGIERFVSALEEAVASDWAPDLILRRAIGDIASFQHDRLRDDATIVWLSWRPQIGSRAQE